MHIYFTTYIQHIKAILRADSLVLIDSDHPSIQEFIPELQVSMHCFKNVVWYNLHIYVQKMLAALVDDPLPFEHRALDVLWQKMVGIIIVHLSP